MSAISVQLTPLVHKKKGKKRGEERNGSIEIEIKKRLSDEEQTGQSVHIPLFSCVIEHSLWAVPIPLFSCVIEHSLWAVPIPLFSCVIEHSLWGGGVSGQSYKHYMLVNYDSRLVINSKLLLLTTLES